MSAAEVEPSYRHLRRAMLDLHGRPKTDPDRLMVWVRNAFAKAGVSFPAFDLAFAIMWERTRGDEPLPTFENPWLHRTGEAAAEVMPDLVEVSRELMEGFAETIPGLGFLLRRGTSWAFDRGKRAWLERTRPQLAELYRDGQLIAEHEMSALMPWMLAQDLNRHLVEHPDERFVLLVDEYERVTEGAGTGARWRENPFDAQMRSLVAETDGLLACFFSRERLPWEDDPDWRELLAGHQHLLGGLDAGDAERWLAQVPVKDAGLRAAMIVGARETPAEGAPVYPLMLDLQVAHWRNLGARARPEDFRVEAATFEGRRRELVRRLLRDYEEGVQDALQRLALAHSFDRAAFEHVVRRFNVPLGFGAFDQLADLSILSEGEDGWLTPHRAVADAIVEETDDLMRATTREALIEHFAERAQPGLPRDVTDETSACLCEAARLRLAQGVEGYVAWLRDVGGTVAAARVMVLEALWRDALEIVQTTLGAEHADTGSSCVNLATFLRAQGRYTEAERLFRRGLEIIRSVLGERHPQTAASYDNLSAVLEDQGRYREAEDLCRRGLKIRQSVFGEQHVETGESYNALGNIVHARGRYAAAEMFSQQGLEIRRSALGEQHAKTGESYNNLAAILQAQGRYAEAESLYRRGLEIRRSVFGEKHDETGASYNNLAGVLEDQGQYAEAEELSLWGLKISRLVFGEEHPRTGVSYNNLGSVLCAQGRYSEAEERYRRGLQITRTTLGEGHPRTGMDHDNLGGVLRTQGRYTRAERSRRTGLEILRSALGEEHAETGTAYNNLAIVLRDQGRYAEAEELYEKALAIARKVLPEGHPHIMVRERDLAACRIANIRAPNKTA